MNTEAPFALFITWTCYGTWLPGDERGYVSNTLLPTHGYRPKQNAPGQGYTRDDATTRTRAKELQKWPTVLLTAEQALVTAQSLVAATRNRGWTIPRAAIMANHAHVVMMNCPDDGEGVRRILKGNSQAALSDSAGQSRRWWTEGGSNRYLHDWAAIETVIAYVANQERKLAEIVDGEVKTHASGGA